jgi:hypothetical protein
MICRKKYIVITLMLAYELLLFGQMPVTVPLDHNPTLRNKKQAMLNSDSLFGRTKSDTQTDTVSLPFVDDFSYYWQSSQPDINLWMDSYVYINNHYPVEPRSNGVATFDALDADGNVYRNSGSSFPADTLTSRPIDLDGQSNVYLSFFYQPQGLGDSPEEGDVLMLQFKSMSSEEEDEEKWRSVWSVPGTTLHPFKQVLIPVEEEEYLFKGFQFRFINYVSLEQDAFNPGLKGNADHWHIDNVRLDANRSETDTAFYDIAIVAPLQSLIQGYKSIPWKQ